jgi:predicted acetyltransferase
MTPSLVSPDPQLATRFLAMAREYETREDEIDFRDALTDFDSYFVRTQEEQRGLRAGRAPCCHFWLMDGADVVGTARVRLKLSPDLEREIGHIGYDVCPSKRGQGYGAKLFSLVLEAAHELGVSPVYVICDSHNAASVAIVERTGAQLLEEVLSGQTGAPIRRYSLASR